MYDIDKDVGNVAKIIYSQVTGSPPQDEEKKWEEYIDDATEILNASTAVQELKEVRRHLRDANRGAEINMKVSKAFCDKNDILEKELKELQDRYNAQDSLLSSVLEANEAMGKRLQELEVMNEWQPIDDGAKTGEYILVKHILPYPDKKPHITRFDSERGAFDMGTMRQPDFYRLLTPPKQKD